MCFRGQLYKGVAGVSQRRGSNAPLDDRSKFCLCRSSAPCKGLCRTQRTRLPVYSCALRSKGIICFSHPRCIFLDRPALPRSSRQDGERRWLRVQRSSRDSFCRNIFSRFSSCRIFFFPSSAPPPKTYLISLPQ